MNFCTMPPWFSICDRAIAEYASSIVFTSSGSAVSDRLVNPTRSQKRAVTTFRSSATGRLETTSATPHSGQNFAPSELVPHCPQMITNRVYGLRSDEAASNHHVLRSAGHPGRPVPGPGRERSVGD
jgi:hypothetical protein